jgi:hypothetical protein
MEAGLDSFQLCEGRFQPFSAVLGPFSDRFKVVFGCVKVVFDRIKAVLNRF